MRMLERFKIYSEFDSKWLSGTHCLILHMKVPVSQKPVKNTQTQSSVENGHTTGRLIDTKTPKHRQCCNAIGR